jgi:hypothetical protein
MPDKTLNAASKRKAGIPNQLHETDSVRIARIGMNVKAFGGPTLQTCRQAFLIETVFFVTGGNLSALIG